MLVVVEDRDVEALDQPLLDLEALGRADVLEVDAAEGRRDQLAGADDLVGVRARDLDVEDVDVGEALEQDALALHHRLAGERPEVAEAEHGRAVRDHGDQVALGRVAVDVLGIAGDLEAGLGDAGAVGQGEVGRGHRWLGWNDLDLPGAPLGVVFERRILVDHGDSLFSGTGGRRGRAVYSFRSSRAITRRWIWFVPS